MNTNIDKKAFCVTEVNTPVDLDKSTISRYATQVVFGSKLKEMLDSNGSNNAETNEKTNEKTKVETKEPVVKPVEIKEPVVETKESVVETKEPVVETKEPVENNVETTQETTQEEITVDEEGV